MANKHILVISQYFYPEQFRINDICEQLLKRGNKVTVLTGIPNYPQGKFYDGYGFHSKRKQTWNGIEIIRIPLLPRGHSKLGLVLNYLSFPFFGYFWNKKNKIKYDLVFMFETSPMNQCKIGVYYKKKHHVPLYLYAQDIWPENVEVVTGIHNKFVIGSIQRMVDKIYEHCDHIFVPSNSFINQIPCKDKVSYLPQYAEEVYHPLLKQKEDDRFTICFTGNIGYAQGLDILPKCAELLKEEGLEKKIRFLVVGDGRYKEKLLKEAEPYNDMFEFVGKVEPEKAVYYLSKSDAAFVSFADNDLWKKSIPAKLQSYLACGMPILASAEGESEKIVDEAKCGYCSKLGDANGLKENILKLMKCDRLDEFSQNAIKYNEVHFNKESILDELSKTLKLDC